MPENGSDWTLVVNPERCMSTGTCMTYASGSLDFGVDGKATVNDPITDDLDAVRAAVESCPTQALAIVDNEN